MQKGFLTRGGDAAAQGTRDYEHFPQRLALPSTAPDRLNDRTEQRESQEAERRAAEVEVGTEVGTNEGGDILILPAAVPAALRLSRPRHARAPLSWLHGRGSAAAVEAPPAPPQPPASISAPLGPAVPLSRPTRSRHQQQRQSRGVPGQGCPAQTSENGISPQGAKVGTGCCFPLGVMHPASYKA